MQLLQYGRTGVLQKENRGDEKWGCIQEPEQLEETLGNLGITKDKEIILIGETLDGWGDDAETSLGTPGSRI